MVNIVLDLYAYKNAAKNMIKLLNDREKYQNLRINAWQWSKEINFKNSYKQFTLKINE